MGRYYEADQSVYELMDSIINEYFGDLRNAKIKILMDTKTQINKLTGRVKFGYIKTANEVEKFLTMDGQNLEGIDYIMFLSELTWSLAEDVNKTRIVRHELRHCFLDEKGNYKLVPHEIEDFYVEIELNQDDPRWGQNLADLVRIRHEQIKAEEKAARNN